MLASTTHTLASRFEVFFRRRHEKAGPRGHAVRVSIRDPRIDPSLIDAALGEEVELLLRLVEAANASEGPLDAATIDAVLFDEDADC